MILVKMGTIVLFILFYLCINAKSLEYSPDLRERMIEPLITCFNDHPNTVITTSDLVQVFSNVSRDSLLISTILLDENYKSNGNQPSMPELGIFVFAPNSIKSLVEMLHAVKSSPWWHVDAFFFIIEKSRDECRSAAKILEQIWKMNLLSTIYSCYMEDQGIMLFTYNPYTNRAPRPWMKTRNVVAPDDRWTLYAQKYIEGSHHCANINFDKTKFLDGYEIKSVANTKLGTKWVKDKIYRFESLMEKHTAVATVHFLKNIFAGMNTTVTVTYDSPGFFINGEATGFVVKLMNSSHDVALNGRPHIRNVSSTYPFLQEGARILTQQRNFLLPEEKIWTFYSVEIWYLTAILLFITFVFILVIHKKRSFASAAFDVLRLMLGTGLYVPLDRTASRIYFFCIFQLFIILNATFQGNISAFLTKPERIYIDTVDDMLEYQYHTYVPGIYRGYLNDIPGIQNIKYSAGIDCTAYVINDPSAACVQILERLIHPAMKHNLHISRSILPGGYGSFWCREDWPLKKKFELYISRSIEAGLYRQLASYSQDIPLRKIYSREEEETAARYRSIVLSDLAFAFRLLAAGLGISTSVFIIEMLPWRKCLRILKKVKTKCSRLSIIRKLKRRRQSD